MCAVHVPSFAPATLISGGGDPELKLWDWMSGEHLTDIPIIQTVEPFITVRPPKGRMNQSEEDDEEGDSVEKADKAKAKGKRGRGKGKGKAPVGVEEQDTERVVRVEEVEDVEDITVAQEAEGPKNEEPARDLVTIPAAEPEESPLVLVVHRIASTEIPGQGRFVLFTAVGCVSRLCRLYELSTQGLRPGQPPSSSLSSPPTRRRTHHPRSPAWIWVVR